MRSLAEPGLASSGVRLSPRSRRGTAQAGGCHMWSHAPHPHRRASVSFRLRSAPPGAHRTWQGSELEASLPLLARRQGTSFDHSCGLPLLRPLRLAFAQMKRCLASLRRAPKALPGLPVSLLVCLSRFQAKGSVTCCRQRSREKSQSLPQHLQTPSSASLALSELPTNECIIVIRTQSKMLFTVAKARSAGGRGLWWRTAELQREYGTND